jgi:hypothetical protein
VGWVVLGCCVAPVNVNVGVELAWVEAGALKKLLVPAGLVKKEDMIDILSPEWETLGCQDWIERVEMARSWTGAGIPSLFLYVPKVEWLGKLSHG